MTTLQYEDSGYRKKQEQEKRDEFAVDFTDWVSLNYFVYNTLEVNVSTKELLIIYKEEKGL